MPPLRTNGRWFSERRQLSHDWLGNRFLPTLRSLHNISRGEVDDPIAVRRARLFLESEWPPNADSVRRLLSTCLDSVGPAALIDNNPYFMACEPAVRLLIAEVVERNFRLNSTITSDILVADKCLRECEDSYVQVISLLKSRDEAELRPELREPLARFGDACEELAHALSQLPHGYELPVLSTGRPPRPKRG